MAKTAKLLIIDPQNDFCDLPVGWRPMGAGAERVAPALPVPGAHADMQRLASLIDAQGERLSGITVTLDSHHRIDIAHPGFWRRGEGGAVAPFTTLSASQVRAGQYRPRRERNLARVLAYLDALEAQARGSLMVWPVHCELGSWGHAVHAEVRAAYNRWEERRLETVELVTKGENPWTEHFSALRAEVPVPGDPATQLNEALVADWDRADWLLVGGEASSHCVRATCEDWVENLPEQGRDRMSRIVLLTDCMSPVSGFEAQHQAFLEAMRERGVTLATAADAALLLAEVLP